MSPSLHRVLPAVALVLGLLGWACGSSEEASGGGCSDDTECKGSKVCEDGKCVPYEGGTGSTGSGTSSSGSGMTPPDQELCEDYLTCLASAAPDVVPEAIGAYGPDGSCWNGGADVQAACADACFASMKSYHDVDPTVCFECYVDADCVSGHCNSGACNYDAAPIPAASPECEACAADGTGACAEVAEACAANEECVAFGVCAAACGEDSACLDTCGDPFGSGYAEYLYCLCSSCVACTSAYWCMGVG